MIVHPLPACGYHATVKTILIDCRFAATRSGLGSYTRELVTHLLAMDLPFRVKLLTRSAHESWIPKGHRPVVFDVPHYTLREQLQFQSVIAEVEPDLLFSPHFNVPVFSGVPSVVTIHDLILHAYPNNASFLKQIAYRFLIWRAIAHATSVITISQFVRGEICTRYGSRIAKKMTVIREGVSDAYVPQSDAAVAAFREKYGLARPFFLYVGNAKQHKNVGVLLAAYEALQSPTHDLILVSGGPEANALTLPKGARILRDLPSEDMPVAYSAAACLLTASLYEGYCLPVAEALACGCPVIAADRTAIPEAAQGRAILVEPTKEEFLQAMRNVPSDRTPHVSERWADAARETAAHLLHVLQGR